MTSVTFPTALGGDGSTVSDDANPATGLRNAGYKTRFVPALQQTINVVQTSVNKAAAASASEAVTVTKAAEARASELAAAGFANNAMVIGLGVETLRPSIKPSLLLDFARAQVVPPSVTFTRASTANRVGPSGLIETVGINVPRIDYDPITRACLGLLVEEQRTNLLTYSDDLTDFAWSKIGVSPSSGILVVEQNDLSAHRVSRNFSYSVLTYTMSFTVKAGANLALGRLVKFRPNNGGTVGGVSGYSAINPRTGEIVQNAVGANIKVRPRGASKYRVSLTFTPTGSGTGQFAIGFWDGVSDINGNYTGDGASDLEISEIGLEVGSFATSPIPTTNAAVTRAADVASVNTLSPWYRADEGTLYLEANSKSAPTTGSVPLCLTDGTTSNAILPCQLVSTETRIGSSTVAGVNQVRLINATILPIDEIHKYAFSYKVDDFAGCADGGVVQTDSAGNVPVVDRLIIGALNSTQVFSGHIPKIAYFPKRLSNAEIQAVTTL